MFVAAVVQLNSNSDETSSLDRAVELIRLAAVEGASWIATPENTNFLGPPREKVARAQTLSGEVCGLFSSLARELKIHLLLGSFNEKGPSSDLCFNTSVLFGPAGQRLAVYRKIHLFDVDVSDEVRFEESESVAPGKEIVCADTELARIGMSICYDLRFPELYGRLVQMGAEVLAIPSAFTATTGEAHWETLIRARAIESQCFVLAPGQCGEHDDEGIRESFGRSMIVDPWGRVLARLADSPGIALAKIDLSQVATTRGMIPVGDSRKARSVPGI